MKRKIVNTTYFDSFWYLDFSYEEYKEMCEDYGWPVQEEGSAGYWDDIHHCTENDWDCFKDNFAYGPYKNAKCMITGNLGLWNGHPSITPVLCDNILDAVKKCISGRSIEDWDIKSVDGHIEVNAYHHDGTNAFQIHLLSKRGLEEVERPKYCYEDYEPKPYWFKKLYGYLY